MSWFCLRGQAGPKKGLLKSDPSKPDASLLQRQFGDPKWGPMSICMSTLSCWDSQACSASFVYQLRRCLPGSQRELLFLKILSGAPGVKPPQEKELSPTRRFLLYKTAAPGRQDSVRPTHHGRPLPYSGLQRGGGGGVSIGHVNQ